MFYIAKFGCGRLGRGCGGGIPGLGSFGEYALRWGGVCWPLFCGFVVAFEGGWGGEIGCWRLRGGGGSGRTLVVDLKGAWS